MSIVPRPRGFGTREDLVKHIKTIGLKKGIITMGKTIEKKILPEYFKEVKAGRKTFELRKDEDDVQVGDTLVLREWDGENYTGRRAVRDVSYVLRDVPEYGLQKGYCIIALTTMFYPSTVCVQNGNNNMHINNIGTLTIK